MKTYENAGYAAVRTMTAVSALKKQGNLAIGLRKIFVVPVPEPGPYQR
jgi:hypothetical protein